MKMASSTPAMISCGATTMAPAVKTKDIEERASQSDHDPDTPTESDKEEVAPAEEGSSDGTVEVLYKYKATLVCGDYEAMYSESSHSCCVYLVSRTKLRAILQAVNYAKVPSSRSSTSTSCI